MTASWPREMVVCLECGEGIGCDGQMRIENLQGCENGSEHGPTQTVSVVPTSEVEGLIEALEMISETPPMPQTMREIAKQALAGYRALQDKGGSK